MLSWAWHSKFQNHKVSQKLWRWIQSIGSNAHFEFWHWMLSRARKVSYSR